MFMYLLKVYEYNTVHSIHRVAPSSEISQLYEAKK